jgi:hypothetical protein
MAAAAAAAAAAAPAPQIWPGGAELFRASRLYRILLEKVPNMDQILQENGGVIAGGSVLASITGADFSDDMDLYAPCRNLRNIMALFNDPNKVVKKYKASEYCNSFLRKNSIRTVLTYYLEGIPVKTTIDIMGVRNRRNVLDVVQNFDLTFCQVWYDGENVWTTHPQHIQERKGFLQGDYVITFLYGNKFLKTRLMKYAERGFTIKIADFVANRDFQDQIIRAGWNNGRNTANEGACHLSFKSNFPGIDGAVVWARKYLFRAAIGSFEQYLFEDENQFAEEQIYLKTTQYNALETGYDSDDYVEDPVKILDIREKEAITENIANMMEKMDALFSAVIRNIDNPYYVALKKEVLNLVGVIETKKKLALKKVWRGWSKGDVEFLDTIFHEKIPAGSLVGATEATEFLLSLCPICLKYNIHEPSSCMYMHHNCKSSRGRYYDPTAFERFKVGGAVYWCTLCGRVAGGGSGHNHMSLTRYEDMQSAHVINKYAPFDNDCRTRSGGGGTPEKVARFIAIRRKAKELIEKVGQITEEEAHHEMIKAAWNAPFDVSKEDIEAAMAEKKFNVPINVFPNTKADRTYPDIPYPDAKNRDLMPILHEHGDEKMLVDYNFDTDNMVQFRHRMMDGTINNHDKAGEQISRSMLLNYIYSMRDDRMQEAYGRCWQYPKCTALLYPEELLAIIDQSDPEQVKTYTLYKDGFNIRFADGVPTAENDAEGDNNLPPLIPAQGAEGPEVVEEPAPAAQGGRRKYTAKRRSHTARARRTKN